MYTRVWGAEAPVSCNTPGRGFRPAYLLGTWMGEENEGSALVCCRWARTGDPPCHLEDRGRACPPQDPSVPLARR